MITSYSRTAAERSARRAAALRAKVPRIGSLLQRLKRVEHDAEKPPALIDTLIQLLDEPPEGTRDRWQSGAEFCQRHGIKTSRMAVWRLYHLGDGNTSIPQILPHTA